MTLLSKRTSKLLRRPCGAGNNVHVTRTLAPLIAAVVLLAGCGSSSRDTAATVSVGAYGVTPATTETTTTASAAGCRRDAGILVRDAEAFVAHFDSALGAYPADLNYVIVRNDLARFRSHGCDPALLGRELTAGLTAVQRSKLVAHLPESMAQALQAALAKA
jgi:hypothetical protein